MTEIATRDEQPAEVDLANRPPSGSITRLADWAAEARAANALATSLCQTSFVPQHFRGKPAEATAAILTGHEMGMSPMAALRAIYVIQGTPAMYAHAMRAVVQSHGHSIWEEEASPTRVVVRGHRKGEPDKVRESVWTMERAQKAGLLTNAHYQKNPQNMLTARATGEVCRLIASDALHGIPYAVEELDDREPIRAVVEAGPRVTAAEILGRPAEPEPTPVAAPEGDTWPETATPGGER